MIRQYRVKGRTILPVLVFFPLLGSCRTLLAPSFDVASRVRHEHICHDVLESAHGNALCTGKHYERDGVEHLPHATRVHDAVRLALK
jgi:hypothetical protein